MAWRIENQASSVDIFLYDVIGDFGITASDFVKELAAIGDKPINLHVNSEGGDVFDALAIYAALKAHQAPVTASIDSLAASAAAFIVMAADQVIISKTASFMVHEAQGLVVGPADDMRKMADLLEDATKNIAEIYADHTEVPVKTWLKDMKAETWYRGEAAVKAGLADEVLASAPRNVIKNEEKTEPKKEEAPTEEPKTENTSNPDYAALFEQAADEENIFNV